MLRYHCLCAMFCVICTLSYQGCTGEVQCGQVFTPPAGVQFIVGGQRSESHQWPWMVQLFDLSVGIHICAGTLISNEWVLTAAHCMYEDGVLYDDPFWLMITLAQHSTEEYDVYENSLNVSRVIVHRNYDDFTMRNDIALLQLSAPVELNDFVQPICLPTSFVAGEVNCTAAGWGDTLGTGYEQTLNEVVLPIISNTLCIRYLNQFISRKQLCTYRPGHDTCQGDSGGPLMCESGGRWFQQGITSWGNGCGEMLSPGVYTRVHRYWRWIQYYTNIVPTPLS